MNTLSTVLPLMPVAGLKLFIIIPVILAAVFVLVIVGLVMYRRWLRIPKPNEALIIMGKSQAHPVKQQDLTQTPEEALKQGKIEGLDFKIATSSVIVNPLTSRVFSLPLNSRTTEFTVDCHDSQKIAVSVRGVILFKIGDNYEAIAAAARRFLDMSEDQMNKSIEQLVSGQVRALVGGITIPQLITDRQKLMEEVRNATDEDMHKIGLQIDSLTIQEITDQHGFIDDLAKPEAERVARDASAADQARQQKEEAKQVANLKVAEFERNTKVESATYQAEQDRAHETAAQAGPLARAEAQREVVVKETEIATLQVQMVEQKLSAEVGKRADAELYKASKEAEAAKIQMLAEVEANAARVQQIGQAEADSTKLRGNAEAEVISARGTAKARAVEALGLAEAKATEEKAKALSQNGQLVIDQRIAEQMPDIAHEIASPLASIDNMMVLDGAEGTVKGVTGAIMAAGDAIQGLRGMNGSERENAPRPERVRPSQRSGESQDQELVGGESFDSETPRAVVGQSLAEETHREFSIPTFSGDAGAVVDQVAAETQRMADEREAAGRTTEGSPETESAYTKQGDGDIPFAGDVVDYIEGELAGTDVADVYSALENNPKLKAAMVEAAKDPQLSEELYSRLNLSSGNEKLLKKFVGGFLGKL